MPNCAEKRLKIRIARVDLDIRLSKGGFDACSRGVVSHSGVQSSTHNRDQLCILKCSRTRGIYYMTTPPIYTLGVRRLLFFLVCGREVVSKETLSLVCASSQLTQVCGALFWCRIEKKLSRCTPSPMPRVDDG